MNTKSLIEIIKKSEKAILEEQKEREAAILKELDK